MKTKLPKIFFNGKKRKDLGRGTWDKIQPQVQQSLRT